MINIVQLWVAFHEWPRMGKESLGMDTTTIPSLPEIPWRREQGA